MEEAGKNQRLNEYRVKKTSGATSDAPGGTESERGEGMKEPKSGRRVPSKIKNTGERGKRIY